MPESRHRQTTSKADRQRAAIHRRMALQRAHEEAQRRAARRRRRNRALAIVACALAVLGPIGFLIYKRATAPPPPPKLQAELVKAKGAKLPITTVPMAVDIKYRIETFPAGDSKGKGAAVTTEDVSVRRPFDGRIVEREGAPPGDKLQLDTRSNLGIRGDYSKPEDVQVTKDAPAAAVGDIRLDASLDQLIDGGFLKVRERRKVLGRECQVYRSGLPIESLSVAAPSADSYADACVDASGLLLEELAVSGKKLTSRVTAVEVNDQATFAADEFAIAGTPKGLSEGGVDLDKVDSNAVYSPSFWGFAQTPAGFETKGRYLLTMADANGDPQPRYVDVYTQGVDFLIIEQGPKAAEPEASPLPGSQVDYGPLGTATVNPGFNGNVGLTHPGSDDWFVQVTSTLKTDALRQALSGLKSGA